MFDIQFLNHELLLLGFSKISNSRVIDTLRLARKKFPGSPASLDALCKRFDICLKSRTKHGALIDSELLASVYSKLIGKKQNTIPLEKNNSYNNEKFTYKKTNITFPERSYALSDNESKAHEELLLKLNSPLWGSQNN